MEKGQQMRGSQTPVQKYWHHLLELVQAGELDPSVVVSHKPPLEEAAHAYKIFNEKQVRGGVASLSRSCPGLAHADFHMKLSDRLYEGMLIKLLSRLSVGRHCCTKFRGGVLPGELERGQSTDLRSACVLHVPPYLTTIVRSRCFPRRLHAVLRMPVSSQSLICYNAILLVLKRSKRTGQLHQGRPEADACAANRASNHLKRLASKATLGG